MRLAAEVIHKEITRRGASRQFGAYELMERATPRPAAGG
jgi:hypothetical protein